MTCPVELTAMESEVYATLIQAARDGAQCPSNAMLAEACAISSTYAETVFGQLKLKGVIRSERSGNGRTVELPLLGLTVKSDPNAHRYGRPVTTLDSDALYVAACRRLFERSRRAGEDWALAGARILNGPALPHPASASSASTSPMGAGTFGSGAHGSAPASSGVGA